MGERDETFSASFRRPWFGAAAADVQLTRFALLRGLGLMYFVAFGIIVQQWEGLLGSRGLMPVQVFAERVLERSGSWQAALERAPSLFLWFNSDSFIVAMGWLGLGLSLLVVLGWANVPLMAALWLLYGAFVHVGQRFYGYGWEMLLLESGFLAIFLAPLLRVGARAKHVPALPVIWLYRWLLFRLMFGAGLIKIRGDACWTDLSCLVFHYETQPNPHPLSWLLHQAPAWFHQLGVLFNHFVELIVPFGLFGPKRVRRVTAGLTIAFQTMLILSGNLSFLNWLTIVIAFACLDDGVWRWLLPIRLVRRVRNVAPLPLSHARRVATVGLFALVALLSVDPVVNLVSRKQRMNASFDPLKLVNTYGAFGSVGRVRNEVIIEGTNGDPADPQAVWKEYVFPCKPASGQRAPCVVTPYHYRLSWQLWFAGFGNLRREPWLAHLVSKLLASEPSVLSLLEKDPFGGQPPAYVRISLYRYELTGLGEAGWWTRRYVREYLPAVSLEDARLTRFLRQYGWR